MLELGFLGDLLVGIGTGILAKTALALTNTSNDFSVVSASLLAGFAGLSYIQTLQTKGIRTGGDERVQQFGRLRINDDNVYLNEIEGAKEQVAAADDDKSAQ